MNYFLDLSDASQSDLYESAIIVIVILLIIPIELILLFKFLDKFDK